MTDRDRKLLVKLRALADHPNTPPHEAEAARARIRAIQSKDSPTNPTPKATADELRRLADQVSKAARAAEGTKRSFDMFDEAIRRDGRTTAQRNEDIAKSWGSREREARERAERVQRAREAAAARQKRCQNPESYYDRGGKPRQRNQFTATCSQCGVQLAPGEGMVMQLGNVWKAWCCESKPGPRKKRFD